MRAKLRVSADTLSNMLDEADARGYKRGFLAGKTAANKRAAKSNAERQRRHRAKLAARKK